MLKNYVYVGELVAKAGIKNPSTVYIYISRLREEFGEDTTMIMRLGGCIFLHKSAVSLLPERFGKAAEECTDLSNMLPSVYAAECLGVGSNYFTFLINASAKSKGDCSIEVPNGGIVKKIHRIKGRVFVEFDPNFIHLINIGYTPYRIQKKSDLQYASRTFSLNNMTIGVY